VVDGLPCFHLVFERVDEVLLSQRFIFGEVDFFDEIFLFYHLAGDDAIGFGVDGEVRFGEAALAQFLILNGVATVDDLEGV